MADLRISDAEMENFHGFIDWCVSDHRLKVPHAQIQCVQQSWGNIILGTSLIGKPICLAKKEYIHGIATHCDSIIKIKLDKPALKFSAVVGIDYNRDTINKNSSGYLATAIFSVVLNGETVWTGPELCATDRPQTVEIDLQGADEFYLHAMAGNSIQFAHADWADARITYTDGKTEYFAKEGFDGYNFFQLPVSFRYGLDNSTELLRKWDYRSTSKTLDNDIKLHVMTCRDPKTGLECEVSLKEYPDFPACWYQVKFRNTSDKNSPILQEIRTLDIQWDRNEGQRTFVHRWNGSNVSHPDNFDFTRNFLKQTIALEEVDVHLQGQLGRCSGKWWPFFNLEQAGKGMFVAVGWTGQWDCDITCDEKRKAQIKAGMENTHFQLLPGEEISQPSVMLMFLEDNTPARRSNIFRRFMREYVIPRIESKPAVAPMSCLTWGGMHSKFHLDCIAEIKKHSLPYDVYWIDAGWYGPEGNYSPDEFSPGWAEHTGHWSVNPTAHPEGFKPISDAAHDAGLKFMVWMEPERACMGTPLTTQHPDWFLSETGKSNCGESVLLNLGNRQALEWLTQFVSAFIKDNGLDAYRQDFNYMPLATWRNNDSPDRQGITEIRHIEGLYKFWDALRSQYPDLLIDNCASGGRRIDIETMSRSLPLWCSDVQCAPEHNPDASQVLNQGMNCLFSAHAIGTGFVPGDTYRFRSSMNEGMGFMFMGYEKFWKDYENYPMDWHKRMCDEFLRAREFFKGDYYPLLAQSPDPQAWCASEFWREDLNGGIAVFFRREESPLEAGSFKLFVPDLNCSYSIENADSGEVQTLTGQQLVEGKGLSIQLDPRQSCLMFIKRA